MVQKTSYINASFPFQYFATVFRYLQVNMKSFPLISNKNYPDFREHCQQFVEDLKSEVNSKNGSNVNSLAALFTMKALGGKIEILIQTLKNPRISIFNI